MANLLVSMLERVGAPVARFGDSTGALRGLGCVSAFAIRAEILRMTRPLQRDKRSTFNVQRRTGTTTRPCGLHLSLDVRRSTLSVWTFNPPQASCKTARWAPSLLAALARSSHRPLPHRQPTSRRAASPLDSHPKPRSADRDTRPPKAARSLEQHGPAAAAAVPELAKAVADPDRQVSANAIAALTSIGPAAQDAIPALLANLDSRNLRNERASSRLQAGFRLAHALSRIGPVAIPPLLGALRSDDTPQRLGAIRALGGMGAEARGAIPALIENFGHRDAELRAEVAQTLGLIGSESSPALLVALTHADAKVRAGAALALGEIGGANGPAATAFPALLAKETEPAVRAALLTAIVKIGVRPEDCTPALIEALRGENPEVRHAAINALLSSRPVIERAIPALITELDNPLPAIPPRIAQVLGRFGSRASAAIPALIARARKEPTEPAYPSALAQIGALSLAPLLHELTSGAAEKEWVVRALREAGSPAMAALAEALRSPNPAVRAGAAHALKGMPMEGRPVVSTLAELIDDPDPEVRAGALRALASVRSQREVLVLKT